MSLSDKTARWWRGLLVIFLTYFYFLLFSQFTFLHLLEATVHSEDSLRTILGAMAVAGIAGSFLAILIRRVARSAWFFSVLLLVCAAVAIAAPRAESVTAFTLLAVLMGLSVGILTVTVAATLPLMVPLGYRGRIVGLGTGLGYGLSNFPPLFSASPETRSFLIGGILVIGALGMSGAPLKSVSSPRRDAERGVPVVKWTPLITLCLVATFTILIWLDSAFFYIIQQNRSLKEVSWEGMAQLYTNAGIHFLAAFIAGWLLDKSRGRFILILAWLGLVAGAAGLQATSSSAFVLTYVVAVSLYSTALVFIPSLHAQDPADRATFCRAAVLYGVSGWMGSGLGIGMAENLNRIPIGFILVSAIVILSIAGLSRVLE